MSEPDSGPVATHFSVGEGVFVGRDAELTQLGGLLDRAVEGTGSIVFVTGEAGVGKTALVGEFLRSARQREPPLTLVRGHCVEQYGSGEAYLPFLDGAGSLLVGRGREAASALLRTFAPTWCVQLPALAGGAEAHEALRQQTIGATRQRMLREMGDVFEAAVIETPMVGLLEDLQWADPSTLDLLRHLINRSARQRVMIMVTFRPTELEATSGAVKDFVNDMRVHNHCQELALGAFGEPAVAAYLDGCFSSNTLPPELASELASKTEGLPLFMARYVQFLVEQGDLRQLDGRWTLTRPLEQATVATPDSVRGMVERRLEALEAEDRLALQHASILGREFLSAVLARILDVDALALEERLEALARTQQLIEGLGEQELHDSSVSARYRFRHSVYQEVLHRSLVSRRRQLLHRQAGVALLTTCGSEAHGIASQAAAHFERGRDWPAALRQLLRAGDHAASLFAYQEALGFLDRSLATVEKLPPAQRPEQKQLALERRGRVNLSLNRLDEAVGDFSGMLALARERGDRVGECAALSGLCNALFYARQLEEMAVRASEAVLAAAHSGSQDLRLEARGLVGMILVAEGDSLTEAKRLIDDTVAVARRTAHKPVALSGLQSRGALHYWQGEYSEAEELMGEALSLAVELRDGFRLLLSLMLQGMAQAQLGRLSEALATLEHGVDLARRNGDGYWQPRFLSHLGWVHRELGDLDTALAKDQEGLRLAREHSVGAAEVGALINLAIDYVRLGRHAEAESVFAELPEASRGDQWLRWDSEIRLAAARSEHWLARGDLEQASAAGERLFETAQRLGHKDLPNAGRLLAEIALARGEPGLALEGLLVALGHLEAHPAPLLEWRVLATLGRAFSAVGDAAAAGVAFAKAAGIIGVLSGSLENETLRQVFNNSDGVADLLKWSDSATG